MLFTQYEWYCIYIALWIKVIETIFILFKFSCYNCGYLIDICGSILFIILGLLKPPWFTCEKSSTQGCFICPSCNKTYTHKKTLSRHIRQECGREPELQCPYCPYRARRAYVLASHVKCHRAFAPCSLSFKWSI